MKTEYRLPCSDKKPVEDGLVFCTELGKSVKDLSQAGKVTSKVTLRQNDLTAVVTSFRAGQKSGDHSLF